MDSELAAFTNEAPTPLDPYAMTQIDDAWLPPGSSVVIKNTLDVPMRVSVLVRPERTDIEG